MAKLTIDLGKGVELRAPFKANMTLEEWVRMTTYIDALLRLDRSDLKADIAKIQEVRVRNN